MIVTLCLMVNLGTVDPKVLLELFSTYRDYQEQKAQEITKNQVFLTRYTSLLKLVVGTHSIDSELRLHRIYVSYMLLIFRC